MQRELAIGVRVPTASQTGLTGGLNAARSSWQSSSPNPLDALSNTTSY